MSKVTLSHLEGQLRLWQECSPVLHRLVGPRGEAALRLVVGPVCEDVGAEQISVAFAIAGGRAGMQHQRPVFVVSPLWHRQNAEHNQGFQSSIMIRQIASCLAPLNFQCKVMIWQTAHSTTNRLHWKVLIRQIASMTEKFQCKVMIRLSTNPDSDSIRVREVALPNSPPSGLQPPVSGPDTSADLMLILDWTDVTPCSLTLPKTL